MPERHVLVTGASTGIGEACALRMAERGWVVHAGVRKDGDGERLRSAGGERVRPVRLDVTSETDIAAAARAVEEATNGRGLDGLVNNAGVALGGPLEFLPVDEWRRQLEINVVGQVAVTRALLAQIRRARGRVVFMGSIAGRVAGPMLGPYSASKHAIEGIGAALRAELLPHGVKVAVVEPGAVKTPIWDKGRQTADEVESSLPPEARRLYGQFMDEVRKGIEASEKNGVPAAKVADAVEKALTSRRPRPRYLVGPDAKVAGNLVRVLPDRVWDVAFRRLSSR